MATGAGTLVIGESSPIGPGKANRGGEQACPRSGVWVHLIPGLMRVAQTIWPGKRIANLHAITGRCDRTIKYWVASDHEPSMADIANLLRSEHGFEFLVALMAGASPEWWSWFSDAMALARAEAKNLAVKQELEDVRRRREARVRRNLRGAVNAVDTHATAIELARRLSDQEFAGVFVAALESMGGLHGGPVAPATARKVK